MSVADAGKVIAKLEENIMKVVEEGTDLCLDPNHTKADELKWDQDANKVSGDGIHDLGDEARSQATDGATEYLMNRGFSKEDADKWPENSVKRVAEISEKVHKAVPKVKYGFLKFVGVVTAIFSAIMAVSFLNRPGPTPEHKAALDVIRRSGEAQRQLAYLGKIVITTDQLNLMVGGMLVRSAPAPVADLPAPVAAVAEVPVIVEIATPDEAEPRAYTSTVAQVYRNSPPQAQRRIEQDAPKIEHDYNRPSNNACNHCLDQHRDQWNRHIAELNAQRQRKDYAITMGDGSTTIGVRY